MQAPITIAIFDDQPIYRLGLSQVFNSEGRCRVIAEGDNCDEAVRVASELRPEVMLLDAHMPGDGIKTLQMISQHARDVRTIMMTNSESERDLSASFQSGDRGYVCKDVKTDQLIDIVDTVYRGKMYMEPTFAGVLMAGKFGGQPDAEALLKSLTVREEQVLRKVTKGMTNKEIARDHGLSEKTVKHHMTSILQKLQARNRVEAALLVREKFGWT